MITMLPLALLGLAALARADDANLLPPPDYVEELEIENGVRRTQRAPAGTEETGKARAAVRSERSGHNALLEVSPGIGVIGVHGKAAVTLGASAAVNITPAQSIPLYFEPGFLMSFLPGDENNSTTLYHLDLGLRFDIVIARSNVAPFVKVALGPTFSSTKDVVVYGNTIPRSYLNIFAGSGVLVRLNSGLNLRADVGAVLQDDSIGVYGLGGVLILL
jgi:hypothetical protein